MSDVERFVVTFVLTRTEGKRMDVDAVRTELEDQLDGMQEVYVEDENGESVYEVEYLVDVAPNRGVSHK